MTGKTKRASGVSFSEHILDFKHYEGREGCVLIVISDTSEGFWSRQTQDSYAG